MSDQFTLTWHKCDKCPGHWLDAYGESWERRPVEELAALRAILWDLYLWDKSGHEPALGEALAAIVERARVAIGAEK